MTANQINYANYVESNRHNLATEAETGRHNQASEDVAYKNWSESVRHNTVSEGETKRHNEQTELFQFGTLNENIRHNKQSEYISNKQANAALSQAETAKYNASTDFLYKTAQGYQAEERAGLFSAQADKTRAESRLTESKIRESENNLFWNNVRGAFGVAKDVSGILKGNVKSTSKSGSSSSATINKGGVSKANKQNAAKSGSKSKK